MKFNTESIIGKHLVNRLPKMAQTAVILRGYIECDEPHVIESVVDKAMSGLQYKVVEVSTKDKEINDLLEVNEFLRNQIRKLLEKE